MRVRHRTGRKHRLTAVDTHLQQVIAKQRWQYLLKQLEFSRNQLLSQRGIEPCPYRRQQLVCLWRLLEIHKSAYPATINKSLYYKVL